MNKQTPAMQRVVREIRTWLKKHAYKAAFEFKLHATDLVSTNGCQIGLCNAGVLMSACGGGYIEPWRAFRTADLKRFLASAKRLQQKEQSRETKQVAKKRSTRPKASDKIKTARWVLQLGTSHFVSFRHAVEYYELQDCDAAEVRRKIKDGEIFLGEPKLKNGQRLVIVDSGTRYAVQELEKESLI